MQVSRAVVLYIVLGLNPILQMVPFSQPTLLYEGVVSYKVVAKY